jgi:site-specific DNA-cytosine methylase
MSDDPAHAICHNEQRTYTNEGSVFKLRNVVAQQRQYAVGVDTYNQSISDVSIPLRVGNAKDSLPAVAVPQGFTYSGYSNQPAWMTGDRTDFLPSSGHSDGSHQGVGVVAFKPKYLTRDNPKMEGAPRCDGSTFTCLTNDTGENAQCVAAAMEVRRLTPRECERLQGFPDDYTLVTYRNKPAADGPRYKALGNSMAVPVMRWIGERIASVDSVSGDKA